MRYVGTGLGLSVLVLAAGCNTFGFLRPADTAGGAGGTGEVPSKEALVGYLDNNSRRVQTLRCDELDLTCSMGIQTVGLRGKLMCQRPQDPSLPPRNLRMSADHWGKTEVEIGSNSEEFWYWMRRGDPYQIHCTYKDLAEGRVKRMPFPFQPEWVMETLGLGNYGPPTRYELDTKDPETLRLVEHTRSPQGTPVRKVIVFRRKAAQGRDAQVTDFLLLDDATGKEVCAAHVSQVQIDRSTGAILPYRVDMRWPEMKLRMTMKFDSVVVNPNPPLDPAVAFRRFPLRGVPGFDLATMRPDGTLQRVQGIDQR
jgi:hypothetical protein